MKKYLYTALLMATCATSLFAQGAKSVREVQGEQRNMNQPTQSGGYMRNQTNQTRNQAAIEGTTVKVTTADGQVFYGRVFNGALKLQHKDMQMLQKSIKMAQEGDLLTIQVGGVTAQYRLPVHGGHGLICCVPIPGTNPPLTQEAADRFAEGKRVVVTFSGGDRVEMKIKNRRVEITSGQRQMLRNQMKSGSRDVQINIANGGMIISGSIEGVETYGYFLGDRWHWLLADVYALLRA